MEGAYHPGQIRDGVSDVKNSVLEAAGVYMALNSFWKFRVKEYIDVLGNTHFCLSYFMYSGCQFDRPFHRE